MKSALLALALTVCATGAHGLDILSNQHVDLGLNFNASLVGTGTNPWRLTARDDDAKVEYGGQRTGFADPLEAILRGSAESQFEVPADPAFSFLGQPGAPVWVLPATQEPDILYLGVSLENKTSQTWTPRNVAANFLARGVSAGTFQGNTITLRLESFSGPGKFSLFSIDGNGNPMVSFDTSNGLSFADSRLFSPGNHLHFNWAFSAPGDYSVGLRASSTLLAGGAVSESDLTTFRFQIAPEPSSALLLAGGLLGFAARRRRVQSI